MSSADPVTAAGEHLLRHGDYEAVLTPLAAGIRTLRYQATDLVVPYEPSEVRPRYRGAVIAPWPNRIVDGRYRFGGTEHQLPLTEPERQHALHGLVSWTRFDAVEEDPRCITWVHDLVAQTGYPWSLELKVTHELGDGGLTTSVRATNLSDTPAPYGVASHPYLRVGDAPLDACMLTVPADRVLRVTPDRLVPVELTDVDGTAFDFRATREVGRTEIDHAFTGITGAPARVELRVPDGRGVACSWDATVLPWLQVHTADVPGDPEHRAGLAVEPMTCPPDAFNSGTDLVVLEPGASHTGSWTISAV